MWVAALLFAIMFTLVLYLDTKKPNNFPPGPKWYPVIGSALFIAKLRQKFGGFLYKATTYLGTQYGPVVGLKIGKDKVIICCDYPSIKEMLVKEEFDGRPKGLCYETRTWGQRRGLLLTDGEFWLEQKRFVIRHLRDLGFGKRTMGHLVETETEHLITVFKEKVSKGNGTAIVEMEDAFGIYVLNTLWMMMASIRYNPEDEELKILQELLTNLFTSVDMAGTLFSQYPFLRHIAPGLSGYKRFVKMHQDIWHFLNNELERHKATFHKGDPRDFIDVYLEMLNSENRKSSYSESQLLAICMDMFMAGADTTSKSLGFGFIYLLLSPDVQDKVKEELDRVVGRDRLPTIQDKANLPYTEATSYEMLRCFLYRGFFIPHRALKDTEIQGYTIPKDTMVLANLNGLFMDKKLWGDPENFRPDRFFDKHGKIYLPDYFLPFGFGNRKCMGPMLAKNNLFLFTASLLQNFNFQIPPGHDPPDPEGIDGAIPSTGKYYASITIRK